MIKQLMKQKRSSFIIENKYNGSRMDHLPKYNAMLKSVVTLSSITVEKACKAVFSSRKHFNILAIKYTASRYD